MDSRKGDLKTSKEADISTNPLQISDAVRIQETRPVAEASIMSEREAPPGPITPDPNRENGEFPIDFLSPLTLVSPLAKRLFFYSRNNGDGEATCCSPRTPTEGVFDPFAPGADELALAPLCKKYTIKRRVLAARRLDFDSFSNGNESDDSIGNGDHRNEAKQLLEEQMLVESIYEPLLEPIIEYQTTIGVSLLTNGLKTPDSAPRLDGIAETCPGAPMKAARKVREIDLSLCRKLEF